MSTAKEEAALIDIDAGEGTSTQSRASRENTAPTFRDAVKKIRFLTLTPKEFAENVPRTNLLSQIEAFSILMNISSSNIHPMPEGFSTNTKSRGCNSQSGPSNDQNARSFRHDSLSPYLVPLLDLRSNQGSSDYPMGRARRRNTEQHTPGSSSMNHMDVAEMRRFYCVRTIREQIDYFNTSVSDCALTFTVDRNISVTGIQVATQVLGEQSMQSGNLPERYSELLYAHLLDSYGTRLTYTHCTSNVRFDSLLEINFDHPVQIKRHRFYKVGVAFNKVGWYPMCTCVPTITCEGVTFDFRVDGPNGESVRDGLIRSIVFTYRNDRDACY